MQPVYFIGLLTAYVELSQCNREQLVAIEWLHLTTEQKNKKKQLHPSTGSANDISSAVVRLLCSG